MRDDCWAVLATGPSLTQHDVEKLRGKCRVMCVSDAYNLAPWCDALVSTDAAWWDFHKPAIDAVRYGSFQPQSMSVIDVGATHINSGALALYASRLAGAKSVLMLGFDMSNRNGEHFFGPHQDGLKRTPEDRFPIFKAQIKEAVARLAVDGVSVVNCSRETTIDFITRTPLEEVIERWTREGL